MFPSDILVLFGAVRSEYSPHAVAFPRWQARKERMKEFLRAHSRDHNQSLIIEGKTCKVLCYQVLDYRAGCARVRADG